VVFPNDDRPVDVRLIGINAPESVRPDSPVECYGPESSDRLAELLEPGTTVYLERDVSDADQFGRLLRHVWVVDDASDDAYLVSEVLARQGFVDARTYPPDDRYEDRLADAERAAQDEGAGLWGACRDEVGVREPAAFPGSATFGDLTGY
jgi:micrococcal nuclease